MPAKNTEKVYIEEAYYHIYNRGVGRRTIFKDQSDYIVFLSLLKRLLSPEPAKDKQGRAIPNYHKDVKLLAFCLMPNHFHLFVFQNDSQSITKLMRSLCTAYTMYFNRKYRRVGHLFQGRFKASLIRDDAYLMHISRYIHLNPKQYRTWEFSSLPYYLGEKQADWVSTDPILQLFEGDNYRNFVEDYAGHHTMLKELKSQLADT